MSEARVLDGPLRLRALEVLGPLGDELARAALESGSVSVEHDAIAWEGSSGPMRGHRVVVAVAPELCARVTASHAAIDSLEAALAAAMSERSGHAAADVRVESGESHSVATGPYRDPRPGGT